MDHAYTDMTGTLSDGRDWEIGNAGKFPSLVDLPNDPTTSNNLVCSYPGCKSSGKTFKRSYELQRHLLIHFPSKKLVCPIQDCKHKKKGKSFTRNDKFREHIAAHGDLALICCPIPSCKIVQVRIGDFAEHIADAHDVLERYKSKPFLEILRIDCDKGRWSCPLLCDFTATGREDVYGHLNQHDLSERIEFKSSIVLLGYGMYVGKIICPVCSVPVGDDNKFYTRLYFHLENSHSADEMITHGDKIIRLMNFYKDYDLVNSTAAMGWFPRLKEFFRNFNPIQVDSSIIPPPFSGPSPGKDSRTSSEPPKDLDNVLSILNFDEEADAVKVSPDSSAEITTQQERTLCCTNPQQGNFYPLPETGGHNSILVSLPTSSQDMMAPPNSSLLHGPLQTDGFTMPQYLSTPQSFIQPQGLMQLSTFINGAIPLNSSAGPTFDPICTFQDSNLWQPGANDHFNMGFGYGEYTQCLVQPEMIELGNANQQQNMDWFAPVPWNMPMIAYNGDILVDMDFGGASNNIAN